MKNTMAALVVGLLLLPGSSFAFSKLKTTKKKTQHLTHSAKIVTSHSSKTKSPKVAAATRPAEPAEAPSEAARPEAVAESAAPESETPSRRPVIPASVREGTP